MLKSFRRAAEGWRYRLAGALFLGFFAWAQAGQSSTVPAGSDADPGDRLRAERPAVENLAESSTYWPRFARVLERMTVGGTTLSPRVRGVLVRVEETHALIDFGRDGVHSIPLEETDVLEKAELLWRGDLVKALPNFVHQTKNVWLEWSGDKGRLVELEELQETRAFLLLYGGSELCDPTYAETFRGLQQTASEADAGLFLVPTERDFYPRMETASIETRFMVRHHAVAAPGAFQHPLAPEGGFSFVLIDADGKILQSMRGARIEEFSIAAQKMEDLLAQVDLGPQRSLGRPPTAAEVRKWSSLE